jgi:flavin reductase (DIM6/NTAB) family NADH-FMN oxidoreductase RutF
MPTSSHPGPPRVLDEHLEVTPAEWDPGEVYFLMTGLVVPRPIAWVSTLSGDGVANVAPHSYFNVMSNDPPHVVIGSSGRKDTLTNVEATGELVVNITTEHVLEEMNATSVDAAPDVDEFELVGLTKAPSVSVAVPRVGEALAHLEARLVQVVPAGNGNIIVAEVTHIHVDPRVWRGGRVDPELLRPVLRFAGTTYATVGEVFKMPRPVWADDVAHLTDGDRSWVPRRDGSGGGSGTAAP